MTSISDKLPQQEVSLILNNLKSIASSVMYAASADTLAEVLERIADVSRELVGARYAALGVPDGMGGLEYFMFSGMDPRDVAKIEHPPVGRGLLGAIMRERQPIRLTDLKKDPRSSGFPEHHPHMEKFLGVPIQVGDQLFGMFYLTDKVNGEPFTDEDQWLIETAAGYAALAIAGAQLRDQQQRLALLEERERIAMELHDGVIQSLYAVGMQIELARTNNPINADDLSAVTKHLNSIIEDIRSYILDLNRRGSRDITIEHCLKEILSRLHIPESLNVQCSAPNEPLPLSNAVYEAVCQMANEAISNVIRHAQATELHVEAQTDGGYFKLKIKDNGVGFNYQQGGQLKSSAAQGGLGLRNIQRRAQLHGGSVEIESTAGEGTQITLSIPL